MTPLALAIATTVALGLLTVSGSVLADAWADRLGWASTVNSLAIAAVAWAVWLVVAAIMDPQLTGAPVAVLAAMSGLAALFVWVAARSRGLTFPRGLILSAVFTGVIFSPVAISLFSVDDGLLGARLATLDLAGALPTLIAAGGASAAILVLARRPSGEGEYPVSRSAVLIPVALVSWALWIVWMIGLEAAIDQATPRIIVSGIVAPLASLAVWLVVQRAVRAKTTVVGAVGGLFCGLASIAPAAAYLDVVGAVLTGAIAGAVCPVVGYGLIRRSGHPAWMPTIVLAVGSGLGTGLLGAFATRSGLMFTGQPEVLFAQFASVLLVLAWSAVVTAGAWFALRGSG